MLTLTLPESKPMIKAGDKEVLLVTNADLRESADSAYDESELGKGKRRMGGGKVRRWWLEPVRINSIADVGNDFFSYTNFLGQIMLSC